MMDQFEEIAAGGETESQRRDGDTAPGDSPAECAPRKGGWLKRLGVGVLATVALIAVLGVLLYNFGGISGSVYDPGMKQQYAQLVASGQAPKIDRRFTIPIPGCKCHSTDPVLTEQHRSRHIRDCSSCHSR